jgi:NitT/TauT family transport system permease protein
MRVPPRLRPVLCVAGLLVIWQLSIGDRPGQLLPTPLAVGRGFVELLERGLLLRYIVASLFRVTWGFGLAVLVAIPLGLTIGFSRRGTLALNPLIQILRPISPLAWIPIAILWFGLGDAAAVFLIFLASVLPLTLTAMAAAANVPDVHVHAGRNFGLTRFAIVARVLFPATLPQLLIGLRLTLGIAWLVVVAAEMIAVNSGLGFLIVDARNAGNRYDLVVAGMVAIGAIGLLLDSAMRRLERTRSAGWAYTGSEAP